MAPEGATQLLSLRHFTQKAMAVSILYIYILAELEDGQEATSILYVNCTYLQCTDTY